MANNRYLGQYPVIGIRPTIDGRRGPLKVREGLEEQTMTMTTALAQPTAHSIRSTTDFNVKKGVSH